MSRYSDAINHSDRHHSGRRRRGARQGYGPPAVTRSPGDAPREIDRATENRSGSRSRKRIPKPLRFFPHIFPVPTTFYGVVTIAVGVLLIALMIYEIRGILSPLLIAGAAALLFYPFRKEPKLRPLLVVAAVLFLIWFCLTAMSVLLPFTIAFLLAYIADPLVSYASRRWYVRRWISALVLTVLFVGLIAVVVGYIAAVVATQVGTAIASIEPLTGAMGAGARGGARAVMTGLPQPKIDDMIARYVMPKIHGIDASLMELAGDVGKSAPGYLSGLVHFMMIPFVMFYFIKDYWRIRGALYSFLPEEYQRRSRRFLRDLDEVVGGFLRGDLITSLFQGTFIGLGLYLIGVPGALLIGMLAAFLTLIPFIGGYISYALAAMAALATDDPAITLLYVTLLFVAQAVVESTVIGPQVMGRHSDLHPAVVIISLLIFGYFMGIGGMLIAIPTTSLVIRFMTRWRDERRVAIERKKVEADLRENPGHARRGEAAPAG
jgi:predicted PurR-regulated permease PerM